VLYVAKKLEAHRRAHGSIPYLTLHLPSAEAVSVRPNAHPQKVKVTKGYANGCEAVNKWLMNTICQVATKQKQTKVHELSRLFRTHKLTFSQVTAKKVILKW